MKNISFILTPFLLIFLSIIIHAQQPSAILDLESTSQGVLIPRMNSSQRINIPTPANGLIVYDTNSKSLWRFDNTWQEIGNGGGVSDLIQDQDNDTKIQVEESNDEDIIRFDMAGLEKFTMSRNFAGSLMMEPVNNFFNTVLGQNAGELLSFGPGNTIIGYEAGKTVATNGSNTYIGRSAGRNATGGGNVFLGNTAGMDQQGDNQLIIENGAVADPLIHGDFFDARLLIGGSLQLGTYNTGSSGSDSVQLLVSGRHNLGVNNGSTTGTYKIKIDGYNNDGQVIYPIHCSDENNLLDFYLKNRTSGGGLPSMYFAGNMAIGQEKFATGYRLSIDGKIACEEVLVDLDSDWPDYVFDNDYELKSLAEVKKYIRQYGHLPGVPAAQTIDKEGIKVGEMHRILMEKVEELTLYILQQEERIKSLEKLLQK